MAFSFRRAKGGAVAADAGDDDGSMPLMAHLRELRGRLTKSLVVIVAATIVAVFFYDRIYELLTGPYRTSIRDLAERQGVDAKLTITGVADPLTLLLKTSLVTGLVASSPVWLYQIWAFIVPAMHKHERRWSVLFAAIAGPLFISGVLIGFYVLPKGLEILIGFTPESVSNFTEIGKYLNFVLRMLLVFGVAFEIPLFVLLLNLAGVVSGKQLGGYRPWIIVGTFVFAAVATPSTDPVSMLFLALPMTLLFLISEMIARLIDRRRARNDLDGDFSAYDDDEVSPLEIEHKGSDEAKSDLDDDDGDALDKDNNA